MCLKVPETIFFRHMPPSDGRLALKSALRAKKKQGRPLGGTGPSNNPATAYRTSIIFRTEDCMPDCSRQKYTPLGAAPASHTA